MIFLKLKHWQLFGLLVGLPMILQIFMMVTIFTTKQSSSALMLLPVIMIISMTVFFGWFYSVGTNLHNKLPESVKMNITLFKTFLFLPVAYICFFVSVILTTMFDGSNGGLNPTYFGIIIPLHFFMMFCMFYLLYFISSTLKAVELGRQVSFNDYAGEFFLIWFFPIGIWFIQPRINELFRDNGQTNN